jgi:predicted enzyme related to lactoylglutathione lyase
VPDPYDALRVGRNTVTPPGDFAARLRGRIREELGMTTTTTTLRELYYTTLTVPDLDRGLAFYDELFGWRPSQPAHVVGDVAYVNIDTTVSMGMNDDPTTVNLWFVADDLDAAVAAVEHAGGTVEGPGDGTGDFVICTDDQGVRFGLGRQSHGEVAPIATIPPNNVGYITITVPDEARGRRFYGEVLGWRFDGGLANPGFITVPMGLGRGEPGHELFVKVDDPDGMASRVRDLGGTTGERQTWPSGVGIPCTDDQGTRFWLYQPAPGY